MASQYWLSGQVGYKYFVEELHEICAIYGKGKYADTNKFSVTAGGNTGGRSFIMEDLGYGSVTREEPYTYAMHDDGKIYRYDVGQEVDGTSTTGGIANRLKYMEMDATITTEEAGKVWKELKTAANGGPTSVTLYQYKYPGKRTLTTTISMSNSSYYLASRHISLTTAGISLGAMIVDTDGNSTDIAFCSWLMYNSDSMKNYGVRPVVYLKSDIQLEYNSETGYTIKESKFRTGTRNIAKQRAL